MNALNQHQHDALLLAQWSGNRGDCKGAFCPVCGRLQSSGGHTSACKVGQAIDLFRSAAASAKLLAELG